MTKEAGLGERRLLSTKNAMRRSGTTARECPMDTTPELSPPCSEMTIFMYDLMQTDATKQKPFLVEEHTVSGLHGPPIRTSSARDNSTGTGRTSGKVFRKWPKSFTSSSMGCFKKMKENTDGSYSNMDFGKDQRAGCSQEQSKVTARSEDTRYVVMSQKGRQGRSIGRLRKYHESE